MKRGIIFLLAFIFTLSAYAQEENAMDNRSSRRIQREQRRMQEQLERDQKSRQVESLIKSRRFILQANYLSGRTGSRVVVDEKINYIIVDSSDIVLQYGEFAAYGGYNGLGGVTTEGRISNYELLTTGRDNNSYTVKLYVSTTLGMYDIYINVSSSGSATATINGLAGGRLTYQGSIKPVEGARIFKGQIL